MKATHILLTSSGRSHHYMRGAATHMMLVHQHLREGSFPPKFCSRRQSLCSCKSVFIVGAQGGAHQVLRGIVPVELQGEQLT